MTKDPTMNSPEPSLGDLRGKLDQIDDALHDLLIKRAEVVERVAEAKGREGLAIIHPGREVEILRRLAGRHRSRLPFGVVARMWREMLSGTVFMQGPFSVAVFAAGDVQGVWDASRDQFGSHSDMTAYGTTREVLQQVFDGQATVGVLPMPEEQDQDPWWTNLRVPNAPQVFARLPFASPGNARGPRREALAIGRIDSVETGDDRTLVIVETLDAVSRDSLYDMVRTVQFSPVLLASNRAEAWLHLVDLDGYVTDSDPRLTRLKAEEPIHRVLRVGGYATPLPQERVETRLAAP